MTRIEYASDRVNPPVRFWLGRSAKHQRMTVGGPELFQTFNDEERATQWMGEDLYNNALWLVELRDGGANGPFFKLTRLEYVKPVSAQLIPATESKRWPSDEEIVENYERLNREDNDG